MHFFWCMEDNRHIVTLTVQELHEVVLKTIQGELLKLLNSDKTASSASNVEDILLTRFEVAKIFKISTVSLDKWKKAGILPKPIKMAGKVYFLKDEIMELINKRNTKNGRIN